MMKIKHQEPIAAACRTHDDVRRTSDRTSVHAVRSNLGPIRNLSPGGMCLLCQRPPARHGRIGIEIYAMDTSLQVRGEVAWVQREGRFRSLVGIAFRDVSAQQARQIEMLARANRAAGRSTFYRRAG